MAQIVCNAAKPTIHLVMVAKRKDSRPVLIRRFTPLPNVLEQGRFYSCALSPVDLGLARDRYSLLDNEFWREQGGAAGWAELLGADPDAVELRLLRRCTYAGRPYGESEYVAEFEQRFGRVWRQWGFEKERHVLVSAAEASKPLEIQSEKA